MELATTPMHFDLAFILLIVFYIAAILTAIGYIAARHRKKKGLATIAEAPPSTTSRLFSEVQWDKLINEVAKITEDEKGAGAQSVLLGHFHSETLHIEKCLVALWHHWDNAGEKLIHPIGGFNEWKEWSADKCFPLINELRDFKVIFGQHIGWVRVEFPGLTTQLIANGFPSNAEYQDVLAAVRDHADSLKELSHRVWDTGKVMDSLHEEKH